MGQSACFKQSGKYYEINAPGIYDLLGNRSDEERWTMRRTIGLFCVVVVMLFGLIAGGGVLTGAGAQDASPPAGPPPGGFEIAPGVMAEAIAFAEGREDPSVYRLTFDAGVTYMIQESPALEVAYVESGSLTLTLSVPVTIGQVAAPDMEGETVATNTEVVVEAGEYLVLPPMTTGEVRNDGTEPASVSIANVIPAPIASPEATPAS
jgi:hypothetical protein